MHLIRLSLRIPPVATLSLLIAGFSMLPLNNNFPFSPIAEAKESRATRAQNFAKKKLKISKPEIPTKSYEQIEAAKKKAEKQRRKEWEEGGRKESLRKKMAEERIRRTSAKAQRRSEEAKERRRNAELAAKRSEGKRELARMATKMDEWENFWKEMLKAASERDISSDYVRQIISIETQLVSKFNEYIKIYNAALSEPGNLFEDGKTTKISLLEKAIEQIEWQFYTTLKTYESPEPTYIVPTPLYVPVPVPIYPPPQPTQKDHEKMCDHLHTQLGARYGGFGSSKGLEIIREAGCP